MQQQDLKQFSDILDQKLDQKFEENNKAIFAKIDEVKQDVNKVKQDTDELLRSTKEGFDEVAALEQKLSKVETTNDNIYERTCKYTDNELANLSDDMNRVKFIHKKEWKKLPPLPVVRQKLAEEGLR